MPRFAVLIHDHPELHWDFLLEDGPVCRTWRLSSAPDHVRPVAAESIPDHRTMYLDYEGPVSGNRGTVTAFDAGTFDWMVRQPNSVVVRLSGRKLKGLAEVIKNEKGDWIWSLTSESIGT